MWVAIKAKKMKIRKSMIACIGKNRELGKNGGLIWDLPKDLKYFQNMTKDCPVIMGKNTYFSIPEKFRPLKNRANIVLTEPGEAIIAKNAKEGPFVVNDLASAFRHAQYTAEENGIDEIFVIGGASVYEQTISQMDRLYITEVFAQDTSADVFFPEYKSIFTKEILRTKNRENGIEFDFVILEK